jgi:hypothetical protein
MPVSAKTFKRCATPYSQIGAIESKGDTGALTKTSRTIQNTGRMELRDRDKERKERKESDVDVRTKGAMQAKIGAGSLRGAGGARRPIDLRAVRSISMTRHNAPIGIASTVRIPSPSAWIGTTRTDRMTGVRYAAYMMRPGSQPPVLNSILRRLLHPGRWES